MVTNDACGRCGGKLIHTGAVIQGVLYEKHEVQDDMVIGQKVGEQLALCQDCATEAFNLLYGKRPS